MPFYAQAQSDRQISRPQDFVGSPHPSPRPSMTMMFATVVCCCCSDLGALAPAVVGDARYSQHGLHVLPSYAQAQEVVTSAGQKVLLQPTPFNAPIHDFVNYTADVGVEQNGTRENTKSGIAQSLKDMAGKLKGAAASQFAPKYGPVTRGDLLLVLPSHVDRWASPGYSISGCTDNGHLLPAIHTSLSPRLVHLQHVIITCLPHCLASQLAEPTSQTANGGYTTSTGACLLHLHDSP